MPIKSYLEADRVFAYLHFLHSENRRPCVTQQCGFPGDFSQLLSDSATFCTRGNVALARWAGAIARRPSGIVFSFIEAEKSHSPRDCTATRGRSQVAETLGQREAGQGPHTSGVALAPERDRSG